MWRLSEKSKLNRLGVHPDLVMINDLALELSPIDFGIPTDGGLRTSIRQLELYNEKKSKCDGTERKSYHQSGNALDFFAYVGGKASWAEHNLALVGAAHLQAASILRIPLEWGGLWGWDFPHIQLKKD